MLTLLMLGRGGGGVSDEMLTLLILGSGGVESHGLEQKSRENDTNNH